MVIFVVSEFKSFVGRLMLRGGGWGKAFKAWMTYTLGSLQTCTLITGVAFAGFLGPLEILR